MTENRFPAWHQGNILRDRELLGLEDYLVSRNWLSERACWWGMEFLEVSFLPDGEKCPHTIRMKVKGVTPKGHPIDLDLTQETTSFHEFGSQAILEILVNPRRSNDQESVPPPPKHKLTITPLVDGDLPENETEIPGVDRLVLGTFERINDDLRLVEKPRVRVLSALRQILGKSAWHAWVEPLTEALNNEFDEAETKTQARQWPIYAAHLARTRWFWSEMPIPTLAAECQFLGWLKAHCTEQTPAANCLDQNQLLQGLEQTGDLIVFLTELIQSPSLADEFRKLTENEVVIAPDGKRICYTFQVQLNGKFELRVKGESQHDHSTRMAILAGKRQSLEADAREEATHFAIGERAPEVGDTWTISNISVKDASLFMQSSVSDGDT